MADTKNVIPTTDVVDTGVDTGNEGNINKKQIKRTTGKKAGKLMVSVATSAALATMMTVAQPVKAEEINQTMVINGQAYTMEQIEANESLWDTMTDTQWEKYTNWQEQNIAESQQNIAESQQNIAESQQNIAESQQNIAESQQNIAESQQNIANNIAQGDKYAQQADKYAQQTAILKKENEQMEAFIKANSKN